MVGRGQLEDFIFHDTLLRHVRDIGQRYGEPVVAFMHFTFLGNIHVQQQTAAAHEHLRGGGMGFARDVGNRGGDKVAVNRR